MSEKTEQEEVDSKDKEELLIVFIGPLENNRDRLKVLEEEGIPAQIVPAPEAVYEDYQGPPLFCLTIEKEDIEDVTDIFEEVWQEILMIEGLNHDGDIIDLSQDSIVCPGCQTEVSEVTEEGECPECGLFLGLPEENDEKTAEA